MAFPEKKEELIAATSFKFRPEINQKSKDKYYKAYQKKLKDQVSDLSRSNLNAGDYDDQDALDKYLGVPGHRDEGRPNSQASDFEEVKGVRDVTQHYEDSRQQERQGVEEEKHLESDEKHEAEQEHPAPADTSLITFTLTKQQQQAISSPTSVPRELLHQMRL